MTCFGFRDKQERFGDFVTAVQHCTLCPRLSSKTKVMSVANGNIDAKVLFVAEAPGRLGADRTGVPLHGDRTGDNFEALLGNVGWKRQDVFVTNAILCNPLQENGNNGTPTKDEIENCLAYLAMTIELVQPVAVVSLGATALKALDIMVPHGLSLKDGVGTKLPWAGRWLVPLYHPGPRAMLHRSMAKQRADFMQLAKFVHPKNGLVKKANRPRKVADSSAFEATPLAEMILAFMQVLGRTTYFKLTKLLYLADLAALNRFGHTLSGEVYLRQPDGPWPPKLKDEMKSLDNHEVRWQCDRRVPMVSAGPDPRFTVSLNRQALEILTEVVDKYGHLTNARIKTAVYTTSPMKYILRHERSGRDMRRVPVIYGDEAAPDTDQNASA